VDDKSLEEKPLDEKPLGEKFYYFRIRKRNNSLPVSESQETVTFDIDQSNVQNFNATQSLEVKRKSGDSKGVSSRLKYLSKLKYLLSGDQSPLIYCNYSQDNSEESPPRSIKDQEKHYILLSNVDRQQMIQGVNEELAALKKYEHKNTGFFQHRSTWMGLGLILLALALIIGSPIPLLLGVAVMSVTALITSIFEPGPWLHLNYDEKRGFKHLPDLFADWVKHNRTQAIIAGVGVVLSLVALTLGIVFFPVLVPTLTLACGCSLALAAVLLMVLGPVTIADMINRFLDRDALLTVDAPDKDWGKKFSVVEDKQKKAESELDSSPLLVSKKRNVKEDENYIVDNDEEQENKAALSYRIVLNR